METVNRREVFLAETGVSGSGYGYGNGSGYGNGGGNGSGNGYGSGGGNGNGYGSGYGSGDGSGYGSGNGGGNGSGYGSGNGGGDGRGVKSINGERVEMIDGIPTIVRRIKGGVAKGAILQNDFTLRPCYVVKQGGLFAHGETLRGAMDALREKLFEDMAEEERLEAFVEAHQKGGRYPNRDFFDWHHRLTGSCEMGRRTFAENHGIELGGSMTVGEFIALTEGDYGGGIIRKLRGFYPGEDGEEE